MGKDPNSVIFGVASGCAIGVVIYAGSALLEKLTKKVRHVSNYADR